MLLIGLNSLVGRWVLTNRLLRSLLGDGHGSSLNRGLVDDMHLFSQLLLSERWLIKLVVDRRVEEAREARRSSTQTVL